jgi:division/cell wall cluster transcriptional repressor MraZ
MREEEQMFLNQFHHCFDDKSRLTIPAKFRDQTAEGITVVPGLDRDLMVLPPAAFQTLYDRLMDLNLTDPDSRLLREIILGNALQVNPDGSGRILLSPNLRDYAQLKMMSFSLVWVKPSKFGRQNSGRISKANSTQKQMPNAFPCWI